MKKLILILFLIIPLTALAIQNPFGSCDKPEVVTKYTLIDPIEGIDYVFALSGSEIRQVGVINYFTFEITYLKKSLRVKSTQQAGSESDPPDQRRKELDDMIRESWPGVGRIQYYKSK